MRKLFSNDELLMKKIPGSFMMFDDDQSPFIRQIGGPFCHISVHCDNVLHYPRFSTGVLVIIKTIPYL